MDKPTETYWRQLAESVESRFDLGIAAILVASLENPNLDFRDCHLELDRLAAEIREQIDDCQTICEQVQVLVEFLVYDCGFQGNKDNYYDPQNSCIDAIFEGQRGIPISLSVILLEVARRLDIDLIGISFPGHFMVKHKSEPNLFVDMFRGGRILSFGQVKGFFHETLSTKLPSNEFELTAASTRVITLRMLQNLKAIYQARGEPIKTIAVIDKLLLLEPDQPREYLVRAINYLGINAHAFALEDLQAYVDLAPQDSEYRNMIIQQIEDIKNKQSTVLN